MLHYRATAFLSGFLILLLGKFFWFFYGLLTYDLGDVSCDYMFINPIYIFYETLVYHLLKCRVGIGSAFDYLTSNLMIRW